MKKIILSFVLFVSLSCYSQHWVDIHNNQKIDRIWGTKVLTTPNDTINNKLPGSIAYLNGVLYSKGPTSWNEIQSSVVNTLNTIADLNLAVTNLLDPHPEIYHIKGYYSPGDGAGGDFILIDTTGAAAVPGMVIPVGSTKAYVRDVSGSKSYNLKWFGAKGGGLGTFVQDSTAIRNAFSFLKNIKGTKSLYVPNVQDANGNRSFYGFAGTGLVDLDNVEVYGDGKGKSEIRNVQPLLGDFKPGTIFLGSNYETDSSKSPFSGNVKKYHMDTAYAGDTILKFRDAWVGLGHDLYVGEIVAYGCYLFNKENRASKPLYSFMESNRVKSLTDTTITFENPITFNLKRDTSGEYPMLFNLNDKNGYIRAGKYLYTTQNFSLHDMTITQAGTDELADSTISARLAGVWGVGGFYQSNFYNLQIDAYSGLGGNLWTYTTWDNIDINSEKKLMDFGYGSGPGNVMRNINYTFKESPASNYASSFFISNNGNHGFKAYNIYASGNFRGSNFFTLTGARDAELSNININFPDYNYDQVAILIGNSDTFNTCTNLTLNNINITYNAIGKGIQILGGGEGASIRNVNLSNISLNGNMMYYTGALLYQFNSTGVSVKPKRQDQYSTNGSVYQCSSSTLQEGGSAVTKWIRISGTTDPLPTGTLTKINGNGDATITYNSTSTSFASNPDAVSIADIKGGLTLRNISATRGRLYLDSVMNSNIIDVNVNDSIFAAVSGQVFTGSRFRVTAPYTNYLNFPGGEINVIGGVSYLNGLPLGVALPKGVNLTYTQTETWDGTAPTGETNSYSWSQDANGKIDLWMQFNYSTAGASNTTLTLDWPTGVPLPLEPSALSGVLYAEAGKIVTGGLVTNQIASFAHIKRVSPGVYNIVVSTGSVAAKVVYFHLTFMKQ